MVSPVVDLASCSFRAMGTEVQVLVLDGSDDQVHWARAEVERCEQRWSRFRLTSDVSRLSERAGDWVPVAEETIELLRAVVRAQEATAGAFDPLLGAHLASLGYDRTFDAVDGNGAGAEVPPTIAAGVGAIEIQDAARLARIPTGTILDLGGIGKGWTADRLVRMLVAHGAAGACANLGGDLAVAGEAPDLAGWVADVEPADGVVPSGLLALRSGGLATSTTRRRRWLGPAGDRRHHLLDPRSGSPCEGPLVEVTVVAPSAASAEVLTKVAFVAPDRFENALRDAAAAAVCTFADGTVVPGGDRALWPTLADEGNDAG